MNTVITLTFGDRAENHVGMEQLGQMVEEGQGFNYKDLLAIQTKFDRLGAETLLINLSERSFGDDNTSIGEIYDFLESNKKPDAYLLIIKDGVNIIYKDLKKDTSIYNKENLFKEQGELNVDKKAFMYGKVVNKTARWNLCFDEKSSEPEYEKGKGRVIGFSEVPLTQTLLQSFPHYFGKKAENLKGEGNYYYDIKKCGIGYHGDSERRKVLAIRLGGDLPIFYQWHYKNEPVENNMSFRLKGGDIYLMSEKAVGTDWKKKNIYTLRHATGCEKFVKIKQKESKKEEQVEKESKKEEQKQVEQESKKKEQKEIKQDLQIKISRQDDTYFSIYRKDKRSMRRDIFYDLKKNVRPILEELASDVGIYAPYKLKKPELVQKLYSILDPLLKKLAT